MPGARLPMRKIRDVLRLTAAGMSSRNIALSLSIGATTVIDFLQRARSAEMSWPLPEDMTDEALEARLFPASTALAEIKARRPQPDWQTIHRELRRKGVTLQLLWEEHRAAHPNGYEHLQDASMLRRCPQEITLVRPGPQAAREQQTLLPEHADRLDGATSARKGLEDQTDGILHLNVRIAADGSIIPVDQTDRRAHLELAAPCLVELATTHSRFEDVQLCLAHRAFEAEQKTIIEAGRIVDAVLVKDESCGQGAQLDEAVPVSRVAREARDLQAHDNAGLAEPHLAHELLEAVARCRTRSRLAEIAIDDMNALDRPARGDGPIAQRILALRALTVLGDLAERRLTDVEVGIAPEMIGGDLEFRHGWAPLRWRRECWREGA